jgi:hypothetical protein
VIYEQGEPWWNDIDEITLLIVNQRDFWEIYMQSHIIANQEVRG